MAAQKKTPLVARFTHPSGPVKAIRDACNKVAADKAALQALLEQQKKGG